jgi:ABC-type multidrug transport system permease subunit
MFYRENSSGAYSAASYHLTWLFKIIFTAFLRGVFFTPLVYFLGNLTPTAIQYLLFCVLLTVADMIGGAFAVLVVSINASLEAASSSFTNVSAYLATVSGFFLRPTNIPPWFIWAYFVGFYKYLLDAAYINQYQDAVCGEILLTQVFIVDLTLNRYINTVILFLFPVAMFLAGYLASYVKTKPKKAVDNHSVA